MAFQLVHLIGPFAGLVNYCVFMRNVDCQIDFLDGWIVWKDGQVDFFKGFGDDFDGDALDPFGEFDDETNDASNDGRDVDALTMLTDITQIEDLITYQAGNASYSVSGVTMDQGGSFNATIVVDFDAFEVGASGAGLLSAVGMPFSRPLQIDMMASPEKIRLRNTSRVDGTE